MHRYEKEYYGKVRGNPRIPPSAAAFDGALTLPLDTLKTWSVLRSSSVSPSNILVPMKWYGYKGFAAAYGIEMIKKAIRPQVYPFFSQLSETSVFLAGTFVGFVQALVTCPLEVVKTQLQSSSYKLTHEVDAIRYLFANYGMRVFFCGLEASMWRLCLWNGFYFTSIKPARELARKALGVHKGYEKNFKIVVVYNILAGVAVGLLGNLIIHPFDVARIILQANAETNKWLLPFVWKLIQQRGFGIFRGFEWTVLRVLLVTPLMTLVYEAVQHFEYH